MPSYQVCSEADLIELAARRGWIDGDTLPHAQIEMLEPTRFFSRTVEGQLPATEMKTQSSVRIRIPDAILHGQNFSLIIENRVFPGGCVHSFWPSRHWKQLGNSQVFYEPMTLQPIHYCEPKLLGIVSHWGHFFVDALDRLLQLQANDDFNGQIVVSDPNYFGLEPVVDRSHAVPQVTEIIQLLGLSLNPEMVIPIFQSMDYEVSNLMVCTLRSKKPSIPASSLIELRHRISALMVDLVDKENTTLFIGRRDVKKRHIVNQHILVEFLASVHHIRTIYPEDLSTKEAIQQFSNASNIILPIGSAKFNLVYCHPGTKVVCIAPMGYCVMNGGVVLMTRHLCQSLGLKLVFYESEIELRQPLINSNFLLNESDMKNIIKILDSFD
ncbi:MAG: glycosyltransferase family 61 protein [Burkholderiales bacterium]